MSICDHNARGFTDDTERFFADLKKGRDISVVIAPAAHLNFTNLNNLIGFLKSKGVKKVFDVSYGADICTWGYAKHIKENNPKTVIAQPCPVVVSYIEKFHTDLIEHLSPVHSPVACLAIYLKKYENVTDEIAFVSPCIGKKRECTDENTNGVLKYNVTFEKLLNYINKNNINLEEYPAAKFDIVEKSIGFAFPRPGGLSENVKYHLGEDTWTKQVEGIFKVEDYFKQLIEDINEERPIPLIIDALNCEHGCNLGTGTTKDTYYNYIDYSINRRKKNVKKVDSEKLMTYFDETLQFSDFLRKYSDKSSDYIKDADMDIEPIFKMLNKITEEDKNVNCFACGYGSCREFAQAVAHGDNHINNCYQFLMDKFVSLSTKDVLTDVYNRYSYFERLQSLEKRHPDLVGILFADINKLKETNDLYGHDAGDELIKKSANILRSIFENNIYRIGGDEFVIIEEISSEDEFENKVVQLKEVLDNEKSVFISHGFAFSRTSPELRNSINFAEKNMYSSKAEFYKQNYKYDRRR